MDKEEAQHFSDMDFATFVRGATVLIKRGTASQHALVEACLFMIVHIGFLSETDPSVRLFSGNLVNHKLNIQVSCAVE